MARAGIRNRVVLAGALTLAAAGCGVTGDAGSRSLSSGAASTSSTATTEAATDPTSSGLGGAVFLQDAVEATREVESLKVAMTVSMAGVPEVGDVELTSEGAFDNRTGQGTMTMDMSGLFGAAGGDTSGMPADAGVMEMVIDGETVYLKSSLFSMLGEEGKPWVKASADEVSGDSLGAGVQTDPSGFLDFLKGASDTVDEVGTEEVRGVSTTHLRAELDLVKLMEDASEAEKAELEQQLDSLGGAPELRSVPVDVWIDGDGYVRKLTMAFDVPDASSGDSRGATSMTMTLELYDFDEPVEIQIPDPSQVGEMGAGMFDTGN